jgi:PKD repeat protein
MKNLFYFLLMLTGILLSNGLSGQTPTLIAVPDLYYCDGETGVTLAVENSVAGTQYRLQRLEGANWINKATRTGNGGTVNFFGLWYEASYRLQSEPGDVVDVIKIEIEVFYVGGGGSFCSNAPEDQFITLSGSEVGVTYTLIGSVSGALDQLPGTGFPLTFGPYQEAQTYTIEAESDVGGCTAMMNGSAEIIIFTAPNAGFTPILLGPPNGCSTVQFEDDTQTPGGAAIVSYQWDFNGDGIFDTTLTPPFTYNFPAYGTGTQDFDVTLKVTDANGCEVTELKTITVNQRPDPRLSDPDNENPFAICDGSLTLNVVNMSQTQTTNTSYSIDWGDGPPEIFDNTFTNASHTYPAGNTTYELIFIVYGPGSPPTQCISDTIIDVFIGSNPAYGIEVLGNTLIGCVPFPITFILPTSVGGNTPGTTYTFDFGDGVIEHYNQSDLPSFYNAVDDRYEFLHIYVNNSCGEVNSGFTLNLTIENPCQKITTLLDGIRIMQESVASFESQVPTNEYIYACVDQPYNFNAEPGGGCWISQSGVSYDNVYYQWDFDNDGIWDIEGENTSVNHTFTAPGIYPVTLRVASYNGINPNINCGGDEMVREVCVMEVPTPDFTLPDDEVCLPYNLIPVNNTTFQFCGEGIYFWEIDPGVNGVDWELAPGSTLNDFEPEIIFNEPNNYQIRLRVEVRSSDNDYCGGEWTDWVPFTVKDIPEVELKDQEPILSFCGAIDYNFEDSVVYNPTFGTIVQYEWLVDGVFASNLQFPVINFPGPPPVTYSVEVRAQNECGWSEYLEFEVLLNPDIEQNVIWYEGNMDLCEGMELDQDIFGTNELIGPPFPPFDPLSGGDGTYTFQWYIDLDEGNGFVEIPLATDHNLVYTDPLPAGLIRFMRVVESGGCVSESNIIEFNVWSEIENNTITNPDPQHICLGDAPDALIGEVQWAGYVYLWEQSAGCTNIWLPAMGTNDQPNYYFPVIPAVTTCYRRVVTNQICTSISDPVSIYVYGDVENNTINLSNPDDSEICDGEDPEQISGSIPTQTGNVNPNPFTYLWEQTNDPVSGNWVNAQGANNLQFYDPPALSATTYYRRKATAVAPAPAGCNTSTSNIIQIIVHPNPLALAGPDDAISWGDTYTFTGAASGGSGNYSYLWEPAALIDGPNNISNPTTVALTSPPSSYIFSLLVFDNITGCSDYDQVILTFLSGNLEVTCIPIYPDQFSMCLDDPNPIQLTALASGGSGNFTYVWITPGGPVSGQSISYVHNGTPGTKHFTCTVIDEFGNSASCDIDIEVEPKAVITSPLTVNLCSGDFLNYTPTGLIGGVPITQFQWTTNPDPSGCVTGNNSSTAPGTIITDQLFNDDPLCVTTGSVSYIITPIGPPPNNCLGTPSTLWVNVAPVPLVTNTVIQQTVISGGPPSTQVNLNSNVAGVQYQWQVFSETCPPGVVIFPTPNGITPFLPAQPFTIIGSQFTCEVTFEVIATVQNGSLTCEGDPFYYTFIIQQLPPALPLICPDPICTGEAATIEMVGSTPGISYQLVFNGVTPIGPPQTGNGNNNFWYNLTNPGNYSVIGTNISSGISAPMANECTLEYNPLPTIYHLWADDDEHCPPVTPVMSGSQLGITYNLILNEAFPVQSKPGDGLPQLFFFDEVAEAGTYTVLAFDDITGCTEHMAGEIHVLPYPQEFGITPAGIVCEDVQLCIEGSEIGVNYQLWKNGYPHGNFISGTGDAICFETTDGPAEYMVYAVNSATGCDVFFQETKTVFELPLLYSMAPDTCCPGCEIILEGWQADIDYFLYFMPPNRIEGVPVFGPIQGTPGDPILSFGSWYDEGYYKVLAVNPDTQCESWMNDSTFIMPTPYPYQIDPVGWGCQPVEIMLSSSQTGALYRLYRDHGFGPEYTGLEIIGSGGAISFGLQSEIGIYTIRAYFSYPNGLQCWSEMLGSYEIIQLPTAYSLLPNSGNYCPCIEATLSSSELGVSYFLKNTSTGSIFPDPVIGLPGTGFPLVWTNICEPGDYYAYATNDLNPECANEMYGDFTILELPDPTLVDPYTQWTNCNPFSASYTINVVNESSTAASNVAYSIDWGDGSPIFTTGANFIGTSHTYTAKGLYNLVLTVEGENGCMAQADYPVFNGKNPVGNFSANTLSGCAPFVAEFLLSSSVSTNSAGTLYHLDFGDGTAITLLQNQLPPPNAQGNFEFTHIYQSSSCGLPGNAFTFIGTIENPCNSYQNVLNPIQISEPATADFDRSNFPEDPIEVCLNVPYQFDNNTVEGCVIIGGQVINTTNYYWDFYNDGTIDSQEENPVFTFDTPGLHEVKLTAWTAESWPDNCGPNDIVREVFVQELPIVFAGENATVVTSEIQLSQAQATNYTYLQWSTFGDGEFSDPQSLETIYTFGPQDLNNGTVEICLTAGNNVCGADSACFSVTIGPIINITGIPAEIELSCDDFDFDTYTWLPFELMPAASNYEMVEWTSTGDGSFNHPNSLVTTYLPGINDKWAQQITLTLKVYSQEFPELFVAKEILINIPTQIIKLETIYPAWNGISLYLDKSDVSVEEVLAPIVEKMEIMIDRNGNYFWPQVSPPINQIGNWDAEGYKIQISEPCCLPVYGDSLSNQQFVLSQPFTFLPVLTNTDVYINQLLDNQKEKISFIQSYSDSLIWTPEAHEFNVLKPGSAYLTVFQAGQPGFPVQFPAYDHSIYQYTQTLLLNEGWNGVSLGVDPYNSHLENIFLPFNNSVIIMHDIQGGLFWPDQNLNTIVGWNYPTAYALKINEEATLEIPGVDISSMPLQLLEGWNYMPVMSSCPVSADELFSSVMDKIVIVKELAGPKVWWPAQNIYTLQDLMPGKGYVILLNQDVELLFPECFKNRQIQSIPHSNKTNTHWGEIKFTPSTHSIAIPENIVSQFAAGDEIGAFDAGGNCFGALAISNTKPEILTLFGNDPLTTVKDGFDESDKIEFRIYQAAGGKELFPSILFNKTLPDTLPFFAGNALSAFDEIRMQNFESDCGKVSWEKRIIIFPNPAKDIVHINISDFKLPDDIQLSIYNTKGVLIKSYKIRYAQTTLTIDDLPEGIFYFVFNIKNFPKLHKKVVNI